MELQKLPATQEMRGALQRALRHLEQCLLILDSSGAPGDIGAHVDLAAERIATVLEQLSGCRQVSQNLPVVSPPEPLILACEPSPA